MKRILAISIALACFCISARAQLNVTSRSSEPQNIAAAHYGEGCFLFKSDELGFFLYFRSSNRYDKHLYFVLGEEYDGAVQTLKDLRGLCDTIGDQILTVQARAGHKCTIFAGDQPKWLTFRFERQAGSSHLRDIDIDTFIFALNPWKPEE